MTCGLTDFGSHEDRLFHARVDDVVPFEIQFNLANGCSTKEIVKIVPGDIIEWVYKRDGSILIEDETLWSTPMNRWVPIGSRLVHTLVSINDERITWLNEEGLFCAYVDDIFHFLKAELTIRLFRS